ncbi:hypothetical protein F4779DRAFT_634032 [Xylariaceae sp. FL0662B]|nr:hypothetical protein F4779DRAFT_634032 [Xylariaceae sp. FL0662B]
MSSIPNAQAIPSHTLCYREKLRHGRDTTPIDKPLLLWSNECNTSPKRYLRSYKKPYEHPYGQKVAKWEHNFFGAGGDIKFRTKPEIPPIRPDAPTMVLVFYPRPDQDDARPIHKSASYLRRIQRIANMSEQTILYIPPELREEISAMRDDPHWYIIDEYATVWDFPNNDYQRGNFENKQPALFDQFDGYTDSDGDLKPEARYNRPHHSAVCNSKAFIMYDAIMRNPFGSDKWMYVDAGFLFDDGPKDEHGEVWGDLLNSGLDEAKFDRAISLARDTGVVMGEYPHQFGYPDAEDECWYNPRRSWRGRQFIAQIYVGNSLGMLEYSTKFMQTVDDMDANGFYTGREELVVAFVALRYPNTVFSVPYFRLPPHLDYKWQFPMKFVFSRVGGLDSVPPITDPISTLYCKDYIPRQDSLPAGGIYKAPRLDEV